jgi:hypothetical protein
MSSRLGFLAAVLVVLLGPLGFSASAGAGSAAQTERFSNSLRGTNEVPPADLDGRGNVKVSIDADAGEVCYRVRFSSTGTPNRGHIHTGVAGANGGIVVPLFELAADPTNPLNDQLENREASGCVTADPALLATIVGNPTAYYVNFHNSRFPGGAIRCQLQDA